MTLGLPTLLLFVGCDAAVGTPTPPPPKTVADCGRYADDDQRSFCVTGRVARGVGVLADCDALAGHAQDCRAAAVQRALSLGTGTRAELLDACGAAPDCALTVLDARPLADPVDQLSACRDHAGPYAQDCTIHALQRWARARPDLPAFLRVAQETDHAPTVGALLGLVVGCQGVGSCDDVGLAARPACQRAAEQDVPSRPEICQTGP